MSWIIFLYLCLNSLFSLLEFSFFLFFFSRNLQRKRRFWLLFSILGISSFLVFFLINFFGFQIIEKSGFGLFETQMVSLVSSLFNILIQTASFFILFDEKKSVLLFSAVTNQCCRSLFSSMDSLLLTSLNLYPFQTFLIDGFDYRSLLVYLSSFFLAALVGYFLIARKNAGGKEEDKKTATSINIVFLISNIFRCFFQSNISISSNQNRWVRISFDIAQYLFSLVIRILLRILLSWEEDIRERAALEGFDENYRKQNERLQKNRDVINIKVHDLKHQLSNRLEEKNLEKELKNEISSSIRLYDSKRDTSNPYLDILLQQKALFCEVKKIPLTVRLNASKLSFLSPSDLTTLFSNAIDNAIEREEKEKEENRFIKIHSKEKGNLLAITIENYCSAEIAFGDDGLIKTDKGGGNEHGYGLRSRKDTMGKYGGTRRVRRDGKEVFVLCLLFVLSTEEGKKKTV